MRKIDRKILRKMFRYMWMPCIFAVVFLVGFVVWEQEAKAETEIISVGYIDYTGFIEQKNGEYIGYGVEYLEKIAEYTDWKYIYIYDTWERILQRLENGEIDMVCTAQYTEERAERFLYSELSMGYESTILYVKEDSDIYYEDYKAMNHSRVGLLSGSFQTEEFFRLAEEKNIDFEPVYFDTESKIIEALENGTVDMVAVGTLSAHADVKAVGRYGAEAFYCITGKDNQKLIDKVDAALRQIKIDEPGLETELTQKYYGDSQISSSPLFTREEHEYIQQSEPITIKLMGESIPLSYQKNGEMAGIFVGYLQLIEEKSGLKFQFDTGTEAADMEELTRQLATDNYLMLHTGRVLEYTGMGRRLLGSKSILDTELAYVKRKEDAYDGGEKDYVFALSKELKYLQPMLIREDENFQMKYYDTTEECLEAVLNYEADIAIQDSYVVAYLLQKPRYADGLQECHGDTLENSMCLLASKKNEILISILNKTINYITKEDKEKIVHEEILKNPYQQNMGDIIYRYRGMMIGGGIATFLVAILYMVMVHRTAKLRIEKKEYEILQKKVQQDELTGIYNRVTFYEKAREMIDNSQDNMCIVIMDISNFKIINDLYGMKNGDKLLCDMAQKLLEFGKNREFIVARFNGDHFYMCMKEADLQKIHFPSRFKTFLEDMDIMVKYGVFVVDDQRDVPINLMCDWASIAVHNKERKKVEYVRYYSAEERQRIIQEQEIENEMERALQTKQFCAYVQPKYDVYSGKIIGGEALVRWIHPQKGMISPAVFIDLFERNGFIIKLDYYVWEETCRLLAELKKQGLPALPISINVSRVHLYGKELCDKLQELIGKYDLEPEELELEITETICAEDPEIIYKRIRELQEAGFKIAMDDFGSGYSSLNMLKEMPLDILKMDLKFLDGGEDVERSQNILGTLITLAHSLKLLVVVEGVETKEQVEFLQSAKNYYAQGYYFSRPVDKETYREMLKAQ